MLRLPVLIAGILALAATPGAAEAQVNPAGGPPVVVNPGDFVKVSVWKNPEYDGEFEIAADSTVRHPLYRSIKAGGKTLPEVERLFEEYLKGWVGTPRIIVETRLRVSVGGEVPQPNVYSLSPEMTVVRAILSAGGPGPNADMRKITLIRGGEERTLDLSLPNSPDRDLRIRSGDQIIVQPRRSLLRDIFAPISSVLSFALLAVTLYLRVK